MVIMERTSKTDLLLLCCCAVSIFITLCAMWGVSPLVDETEHLKQILLFMNGQFALNPSCSMGPGYHILITALAALTGYTDINILRLFSAFISVCCMVIFYIVNKQLYSEISAFPALQFMFLPIMLPYSVLVYTDVFSLLLMLLCLSLQLRGRIMLSGVVALAAMFTRQTNIVVLVEYFVIGYYSEYGFALSLQNFRCHMKKYWPYIAIGLLFCFFIVFNGRVSLGGTDNLVEIKFQLNNIFYFMMVYAVCFLPIVSCDVYRGIKERLWITLAVVVIVFVVYMLSFNELHYFNTIFYYNLLRNYVLLGLYESLAYKIACFVPIALSAVHFAAVVCRRETEKIIVIMFSSIYLAASFVVEPRYYIPLVALLVIYSKPESQKMQVFQTVYALLLSAVILYAMRNYELVM